MTLQQNLTSPQSIGAEAQPDSSETSARNTATPAFAVIVAGYTLAIGIVEVMVAFGDITSGIAGHALLVLLLLIHSAVGMRSRPARILPVMALLPLMRILSLTMVFQELIPMYWFVLVGAPVLFAAVMTAQALGMDAAELGLKRTRLWPQAAIAISGIGLGFGARLLLHPTPLVTQMDWLVLAIGAAILTVFVGLTEEILFRGLMQRVADEIFPRTGIYLVNVLFALMYLGTRSPAAVVFFGLTGLYFSWCVKRTGATWGVIIAHGMLASIMLLWPVL